MAANLTLVDLLVHRARRRAGLHAIAGAAFQALSAAFVAAALLLIAGTNVVAWYLPVLVFVVALAALLWLRRKALPGEYDAARSLDSALDLGDLLSSAWHAARRAPDARFTPPLVDQAESAARVADSTAALRWRWPRAARWTGAAALAVLVLIGLRYGILRTLDLRASLVPVVFDTFTGQLAATAQKKPPAAPKLPQPFDIGLTAQADSIEKLPNDEMLKDFEVAAQTDSGKPVNAASPYQNAQHAPGQADSPEDPNENVNLPDGAQGPSTGANDRKSSDAKGERKSSRPPDQPNSLLDKMRDALASLMEKLKLNGSSAENPQNTAALEGQRQEGQRRPGEQNNPNRGKPQQGDPNGQQSQDQADSSQAGQNTQADSSIQPTANQQRSGIGRQDGNKNTSLEKEAEALGKLSELIGKRSLSLQGDMTVEVENTSNPQLRTPYLNRSATHAEAGGDLSRDEVPLRHQDFVRRYYEQIRSQPDSLPPPPPKKDDPNSR